ncbi:MAG: 7-cyano-7-deazaguanine synthase [Elusimicrobiales bacterium]|nr:7-cyano-7-deazaguanine synthase [Elusimicrobiales bacterium]
MPEAEPWIRLDAAGICNICLEHAKAGPAAAAEKGLETDFTKILAQHRGKHEYDCLVMCSGGKDSTASLYYMKTRYNTKPLAFTFDHGFETEEAMENVRGAVAKLGVDFVTFRSDFMHDMFAKVIKTGSKAVLCHLCSIWYMDLTFRMAERFDIPIIIAGWTKGQSLRQPAMTKCACNIAAPEFAGMAAATREFLDKHVRTDPKYKDFPGSMEEVLARAQKRHKCLVLSPHWFLPYDSAAYTETIMRELGWKYPRFSYPAKSTNCSLNFISVHNSMKHFGYTHYHVEMSKLVRDGLLTRAEALELLKRDFSPEMLNRIAEPLGCKVVE